MKQMTKIDIEIDGLWNIVMNKSKWKYHGMKIKVNENQVSKVLGSWKMEERNKAIMQQIIWTT